MTAIFIHSFIRTWFCQFSIFMPFMLSRKCAHIILCNVNNKLKKYKVPVNGSRLEIKEKLDTWLSAMDIGEGFDVGIL